MDTFEIDPHPTNYTTQSFILANSSRPRSPFPPRNDRVQPLAVFHSRLGAFLVLGRRQKVVEDGVEHLGIPHWFVLDACLVLAGGKGFLSSTPVPSGKISTSVNDFLTGIEYWFFLDDATDYTICTDFSDWEPLPWEDVPERWLAIDKVKTLNTGRNDAIMESSFNKIGNHLIYIDKFCALSGFDRELRAVHLIPQACAPWVRYCLFLLLYIF